MNTLLTPDGQPNWVQTGKETWKLELGDGLLTMEYHERLKLAKLWRDGRFVKRFQGEDCVEQLNTNVLRQIKRLS